MLVTRAKNRAGNDNATDVVKYWNKGVNYLNFGHPECTKAKNLCDSKLFRAENAFAVYVHVTVHRNRFFFNNQPDTLIT